MDIVEELRKLVGSPGVLSADDIASRAAGAYRTDHLQGMALVRPASTAEVAKVLRWCHAHGVAVVTQGGLTGLVRGADAAPNELILSMERMRVIEHIDTQQRTATVQAGVTLQALQEAVDAQGLAYPLDLGARGSATLGGTAATNAGGNRVIRYGMTRDMVLGLEVVLADGTILSSMNCLIKNNTGYDLKQLFIGSEGTLGVITRLVLRLRERPTSSQAAFVGLDGFDQLADFLRHMDRSLDGRLSAFEVMWRSFYRLVTSPPAKGKPPISVDYPLYVLVESLGNSEQQDCLEFESALELAMEEGLIAEAAVAKSEADCREFWQLRDDVAQVFVGGAPIGFDVSLPIRHMNAYLQTMSDALQQEIGEDHRLFVFGHLGDGNLHVVVQIPPERYAAEKPRVEALVYRGLDRYRGSVSAEHGIGLAKREWLSISRNAGELAVMKTLKRALDPTGILNPGKILEVGILTDHT